LARPLIRAPFPRAGGQAKRSVPLTAWKFYQRAGTKRAGQASCQL